MVLEMPGNSLNPVNGRTATKETKGKFISRLNIIAFALLLPGFAVAQAASSDAEAFDVTQVPIEQLVATDYIPASRIARQISDAPSAVSIVTAQDIHDYGYRTLADIMKSMRGLFVTTSKDYDYLGGRGFGAPGDYAGRIMLMIDGYATNEGFYNQIFLGEDALLDVETIERVEYIPGPGSTTYGNSAVLGVINIVTKHGKSIGGTQVAAGFGNRGERKQRLTFGKQLENGADILLSVSKYADQGSTSRFSANNSPVTGLTFDNQKKTDDHRLLFKGSYEGWTLELANTRKTTGYATMIDTIDPVDIGRTSQYVDNNGFANLKYDTALSERLSAAAQVYYGRYLYTLDYYWAGPDLFTQQSTSRWRGADLKFIDTGFDRHRILFGGEYRDDFQQQLNDNGWPVGDPLSEYSKGMRTASLYVQDEYAATDKLTLTPGLRYDRHSMGGLTKSPRMAAIYRPWQASTFKLSYGTAFRHGNAWDYYWSDIPRSDAVIKPEKIATSELVWQQQFTSKTRSTVSLFRNHITDAVLRANQEINTIGQEIGIEHVEQDGFRLSSSVVHQKSTNGAGDWKLNCPNWLGKLNVVEPLFHNLLNAGFEVQTTGPRRAADQSIIKASTVANLTLSSNRLIEHVDISLRAQNLFNAQQEDVQLNPQFRTLFLSGRRYGLQLEYTFK
jgi:iron complex outermembrane receptor protein